MAVRQGYENLIPLYEKTLTQYPRLELEERMLNTLGLRLSFDAKRREQGINVLLLAVYIYPKSANLYDSLAEAYLSQKDFENAIVNFKKSLALNPENQNAMNRLKQLKQ